MCIFSKLFGLHLRYGVENADFSLRLITPHHLGKSVGPSGVESGVESGDRRLTINFFLPQVLSPVILSFRALGLNYVQPNPYPFSPDTIPP